jgi:hypothetical protein
MHDSPLASPAIALILQATDLELHLPQSRPTAKQLQ